MIENIILYLIKYFEKLYAKNNQRIIIKKRNYAKNNCNFVKRINRVNNAVRVYRRNPKLPPAKKPRTIIDKQLGLYYK